MGGAKDARLNATVYVQRNGNIVGFGPDDDVPEDVARQIGAHAWEGGVAPFADEAASDGPPPKAGSGSSVKAWVKYAEKHGVEVDDGASRDDVIAALEAAGFTTE